MDDVADLKARRTITDREAERVNTEIEKETKIYNDSNKAILENNKRIKDIEDKINKVSYEKTKVNQEPDSRPKSKLLHKLSLENITFNRNIRILKEENTQLAIDVRDALTNINHLSASVNTYKQEVSAIQAKESQIKKENYNKLKAYTEELNLLNTGAFYMDRI